MRKDEQGNKVEGFQILIGGGMGRTPVLAETHTTFVPSEKVVNFIVQNI
jgi:sulfite reductase beta subunit-like hemoprotein